MIKKLIKNSLIYRLYSHFRCNASYVLDNYPISSNRSHLYLELLSFFVDVRRNITPKQFCYFRYAELSRKNRKNIVSIEEQKQFYKKVNSRRAHDILCDKFASYELLKDAYGRECVLVKSLKDIIPFGEFLKVNNQFVVKPLGSNQGKGVMLVDNRNESNKDINYLLQRYPNGFIAEAVINQSEQLGVFHPGSVNTIRANTVRYDDVIEVVWPVFRIGQGDSFVDNAGAGGIVVAIDALTGVTLKAADERGRVYQNHPDSNIPLGGYQIPDWAKACDLIKSLAVRIPDCRFIGWDLALTDSGWVVVEGNYAPLNMWQIAMNHGIRADFEMMKNRLYVK